MSEVNHFQEVNRKKYQEYLTAGSRRHYVPKKGRKQLSEEEVKQWKINNGRI